MALSHAQLMSLLAPTKTPKTNAWIKITDPDKDHVSSIERRQVSSADFGKYVGKAGDITRNAKGRTRRLPNGRRYYENPAMGGSVEVVAYTV